MKKDDLCKYNPTVSGQVIHASQCLQGWAIAYSFQENKCRAYLLPSNSMFVGKYQKPME